MKKGSFLRVCKVSVNIFLGIVFMLIIRALARGIGQPGLFGDVFRLAFLTYFIFRCVRAMARRSGLGISECYISRPVFSLPGITTALFLPAAFCLVLLLIPGKFSYHRLPAGEIFTVFLPLIIDMGLGSGINEELVFRGYLLKMVEQNYGRKLAVLVTSLAFGAMHLLNQPLPAVEALMLLAFTTSLGMLFSVLTLKSGNIWNAVLVHGFVNTWGVLFTSGPSPERNSPFVYTLSENLPVWLTGGAASAPVTYTAVIWIVIAILCWNRKGAQRTDVA